MPPVGLGSVFVGEIRVYVINTLTCVEKGRLHDRNPTSQ